MAEPPTLKRSLSLPLLTLYGLGTTVGAGIYALAGEVAGSAGMFAPIAFLIAAVLAGLSAFSFAELSSRFPKSAGEALYVREAFGSRALSLMVGLLVVVSGTISTATITGAFVGYVQELVEVPRAAVVIGIVALMALIAVWGITESVATAGVITLIEVGGLVLVIWVAGGGVADLPARWPELVPPFEPAAWSGILAGTFLAFFAFIGFEDMVNVAEEVKQAPRTLPVAIILTLGLTTVIYIVLMVVAVLALPAEQLAASEAPMVLLYRHGTGGSAVVIGLIGIVAMVNGALIQIIMATRVLYGMAAQGLLPGGLAAVHPGRRTPARATLLVAAAVLVLALVWRVAPLAEATSVVTLTVFTLVNLALCLIKWRRPAAAGVVTVPLILPATGFLVSAGFLVMEAARFAAAALAGAP